jgi:hypothetical protein
VRSGISSNISLSQYFEAHDYVDNTWNVYDCNINEAVENLDTEVWG